MLESSSQEMSLSSEIEECPKQLDKLHQTARAYGFWNWSWAAAGGQSLFHLLYQKALQIQSMQDRDERRSPWTWAIKFQDLVFHDNNEQPCSQGGTCSVVWMRNTFSVRNLAFLMTLHRWGISRRGHQIEWAVDNPLSIYRDLIIPFKLSGSKGGLKFQASHTSSGRDRRTRKHTWIRRMSKLLKRDLVFGHLLGCWADCIDNYASLQAIWYLSINAHPLIPEYVHFLTSRTPCNATPKI